MRRRRFLLAAATAPLVAGCSVEGYSPVEASAPDGDGTLSAGEFRWHLEHESDVSAGAVTVIDMRRRGGQFGITYRSDLRSTEQLLAEIEVFYTTYAAYLADREGKGELSVSIQGPADEEAASFDIQANWVRDWHRGDLTAAALRSRIRDTVER